MATGSIKWFGKKGFGFIVDDEGQEVFFHIGNSPALRGKENSLVQGTVVEFDKRPSSKKGKDGTFEAHNVALRETPRSLQTLSATEESQPTTSHFHNPYTFVPTPPRGHIAPDQFAGDYDPVMRCLTHSSLQPELWTGRLPIKLTTVTPLLLPDVGDKERKATEHQIYDMLYYLPESALRGMLRSAYEVVTNSRYISFRNSDRLAYRMETADAISLIPAMIEQVSGKLEARLYLGETSRPTSKGPDGPIYAAMLTLYGDPARRAACGHDPKTGDEVWAEIVLCQHEISPRDKTQWQEDFTYGSPIFKAVPKKRCKALYRALKKSPKSPELAVGAGSEPSYVDRSAGAP